MEFQLANRDKISWLMIGENLFTYDEPGPKEIDLAKITANERNQLLYNCRRGALACSDPDALVKACQDVWAASPQFATPQERPIQAPKDTSVEDLLKKDTTELRKILKGSVSSVAKKVAVLSPAKVRKLLEIESKWKNRKSIKNLCNEVLAKHADGVMKKVVGDDVGDILTPTGEAAKTSPNVSDIVESDIEYVVLNPLGDEEKNVGTT